MDHQRYIWRAFYHSQRSQDTRGPDYQISVSTVQETRMSKTRLGYVQLHAAKVIDLSQAALADIAEQREQSRKNFIAQFTDKPVGRFGRLIGRKPMTEEQAIEAVKGDTWLAHEYWYLTPKFVSEKQDALKKLINVGLGLLEGGYPTMEVSIEAANWLYKSNI